MKISIDITERDIKGAHFYRAIVEHNEERTALESPHFDPKSKEGQKWSMRYLLHQLGEVVADRVIL